jgi:membrane protein
MAAGTSPSTSAAAESTTPARSGWRWWCGVGRATVRDWSEDKASRLGAALAYYTIFSLAPLLLIAVALAGLIVGQEAAMGRLHDEMQGFVGQEGAAALQEMIAGARKPVSGGIATVIGIGALVFGASGVVRQLKDALNTIWEVPEPESGGILRTIKDHFLSIAMLLGICFLLLVSLVLDTALTSVRGWMIDTLPGPDMLWGVVNTLLSFGIAAALFAMIFKFLPDARIAWKHVWPGAAATAVLFLIGKWLFALYLGRGTIGSTYGAAGALIVVLLWAYYSAQILLLGAEFTQAYAHADGDRLEHT